MLAVAGVMNDCRIVWPPRPGQIGPRPTCRLAKALAWAEFDALTLFERYFRIVNEAVRLKSVRAPRGVVVAVNFVGLPRHMARQNAEFGIAAILKALREVAGRSIRPTRTAFMHARSSDLRDFERFYGCPVEFGRAAS